jgi:hypothetical protein
LGTRGADIGLLQVPAIGGTGRRARVGVGAVAGVPSCAIGVGAGSDQAHMWGPDSRAVVRSGATHGGLMTERR